MNEKVTVVLKDKALVAGTWRDAGEEVEVYEQEAQVLRDTEKAEPEKEASKEADSGEADKKVSERSQEGQEK